MPSVPQLRRISIETKLITAPVSDQMAFGLFLDCTHTEAACTSISDRGYSQEDVNVVMVDDTRKHYFSGTTAGKETEPGNKAAGGAGIGGTVGAIAAAVGTTLILPDLFW